MTTNKYYWECSAATINDTAFIISNWEAEARVNALQYGKLSPGVIKTYMPSRVRLLLSRCPVICIRVNGKLTGFCCYSFERKTLLPIIHSLFVERTNWKRGIGTTLLEAAGVADGKTGWHTTHALGIAQWPSAAQGLLHNPYLLDYNPEAPGDRP